MKLKNVPPDFGAAKFLESLENVVFVERGVSVDHHLGHSVLKRRDGTTMYVAFDEETRKVTCIANNKVNPAVEPIALNTFNDFQQALNDWDIGLELALFLRRSPNLFRFLRTNSFSMDSSVSESATVDDVYNKAEEYWTQASEDIDGMLGGFAQLHSPDITLSKKFIRHLQEKNFLVNMDYAIDCGAGIGRVTKHLLLPLFSKVDMVDVAENLIVKSKDYIGPNPKIGEKFVEGLQSFAPPEKRYDLIWIQWVSGHLTDSDFVKFFERCKEGLREGGVIVLKDNLASGEKSVFDCEDHSWTRPEALVEDLFEQAGLRLVAKNLQTGFPKGMYKVKLFALQPQH